MNSALQGLYFSGSPITALRKSSWLKAYQSARRTRGLSNGLCRWFRRNMFWLPTGLRVMSWTLRSALSRACRSKGGASMKSISPACSALIACRWSGMACHSMRPTLATLPPGQPRAGLGTRLVVGIADIDANVPRPPLIALEDERPRAGGVGDLGEGIGVGDPPGHHERHG